MIHARNLARRFRVKHEPDVVAVDDIDLDIEPGELVALLGPNGAGKSTTFRMLSTLLLPTSGSATVAGYDLACDAAAVRRRIGLIGQGNGSGDHQQVRDELVVQGYAYGLDRRTAGARADALLDTLQLGAVAKRGASTLSGGQRRRLDIALGLVHRPPLLFLDEPSTGLDPQNRANLWRHVMEVRREYGTTLFFSTHYLEEADLMAERVLIIDHGRVVADAPPARLKAEVAGDRITLHLADRSRHGAAASIAASVPGISSVDGSDQAIVLTAIDGAVALPAVLRALEEGGLPVAAAEITRPTLDDVFLALTGRSLREEGALALDGDAPTDDATEPAAANVSRATVEVD